MTSLLQFYFSKHYQVINPEINVTILYFGSNLMKKKVMNMVGLNKKMKYNSSYLNLNMFF